MAVTAMMKKTLLFGVVLLAVTGAVVRGTDVGDVSAAGTGDQDSQAIPLLEKMKAALADDEQKDVEDLLRESVKGTEVLERDVSKARIPKYTLYGSAAAGGIGALGLFAHQIAQAKSGSLTRKGSALGIALASLTALGIGGLVASLVMKNKADAKAKAQARSLLRKRQILLEKAEKLEEEELGGLWTEAEQIANAAGKLGMYVPDAPPPPESDAA